MPEIINEKWEIEINHETNKYVFRRFLGEVRHESYYTMNKAEATIAAVSIIQGFEPPRIQSPLDILQP